MKLFKNYKKLYEQGVQFLNVAADMYANVLAENDELQKRVDELEAINQAQDRELRNLYGKIAVAKQALDRAKK